MIAQCSQNSKAGIRSTTYKQTSYDNDLLTGALSLIVNAPWLKNDHKMFVRRFDVISTDFYHKTKILRLTRQGDNHIKRFSSSYTHSSIIS